MAVNWVKHVADQKDLVWVFSVLLYKLLLQKHNKRQYRAHERNTKSHLP